MPPHNFKKFPELRTNQFDAYYFDSPHRQITEDFHCQVIKVTDGDTIRVEWVERDFDFPIRLANIAAPETLAHGGKESAQWLADQILNKYVRVEINPFNRVGRWGRIIGTIIHEGQDINQLSLDTRHSIPFDDVEEAFIPRLEDIFNGA